jgi:sulfatase maturation enzyme AslB (radical SAM superfamily)
MAGAIAGTAILKACNFNDKLHTITLTINNECNLNCPHCYLHYKSDKGLISQETIVSIFKNNFKHIAIVGQEPLYNQNSINKLTVIANIAKTKGITVSVVTNGLNLKKVPKSTLELIDYIDISFDGGEKSYSNFRRSSLNQIIDGVTYLENCGLNEINALHTLCDSTKNNVSDCINIKNYAHFSNIMFSPYLITNNFGKNSVKPIYLIDLINLLASNELFMSVDEAFLLIDNYHMEQDCIMPDEVESLIAKNKIERKIKLFKHDPIFHGILRVTYDDLVLSPRDSLHTKHYFESNFQASNSNIEKCYDELLVKEFKYAY